MTGTLYTVTKKPNSTAQPTGTGTGITFRLKGACSVQAPVLSLWSGGPVNLFSTEEVIRGFYMSSTGTITTSTTYCVSDYIPITAGTTYTLNRGAAIGTSQRYINYFDVNFNRLGNITGPATASGTFAITNSSARYIRFNYLSAYEAQVQLTGGAILRQPSGNYLHIPAFGRYYWIEDMTYDMGEWTISCRCDVLASYKSLIGASSQYVLRSASSYDQQLIDSLYPVKGEPTVQTDRAASGFSNTGLFIVGIIGAPKTDASPLGLTYYAMTASEFIVLLRYLNTASSIETFSGTAVTNLQTALDNIANFIQDTVQDIAQWLLQPMKFVQSCLWLPITLSDYLNTTAVTAVEIGGLASVTLSTRQISGNPMNIVGSITVPSHPSSATRGTWCEDSPYSERVLYIPGVGSVPLPAGLVRGGRTVSVSSEISAVDGRMISQVTCFGQTIGYYQGRVGTSVQLSGTTVDIGGSVLSTAGGLQRLLGGDAIGAAAGILSGLQAAVPAVTTMGSDGGTFPLTYQNIELTSTFWTPADEDLVSHGRPLCQVKTISTLSGYVLCENAEISIPGTKQEADEIMNFLNGGFYYE